MGYLPALDGLRAVAVAGVIAYHLGLPWAQGGFLGVDAFFVLSGYLITSLLLAEREATGRIALGAFWARRARRLLPALFLMLAVVAGYGALAAPTDTLGQLRSDALFTLGYGANWHQIFSGQGYFAQLAQPSPLLHTWSLAIEEQFYLLWPLALLALGRTRRRRRNLAAVCALGVVASAVEMALLYRPADTARAYFGTDTRAQSLLVGALLATLVAQRCGRVRLGPRARLGLAAGALAGTGYLAWAWSQLSGASPFLYRGGFAVGAVAVAAVIAATLAAPRGFAAWVLSAAPLRFLGRISYGLYLWHWPVFVALDHARTGLLGPGLAALRLATTLALAVTSFYLVEQPVRRGALRSWRAWVATPAAAGAAASLVMVATVPVLPAGAAASKVLARLPTRPSALGFSTQDQTQGVSSQVPAPRPVRALLVGDSVALTLGEGLSLAAPRYGIQLDSEAEIGCGVARGGPYNQSGVVGQPLARCATWPQAWSYYVATLHPDVVLVLIGRWEMLDRVHDGAWMHLGQAPFDAYIAQELRLAVSVLSQDGAHVVLMTCPYFQGVEAPDGSSWPEDDPHRVDVLNGIIRQVAAQYPAQVSLYDLNAEISPGGYHYLLDGVAVRSSDGVHISVPGGAWVAQSLFPKVLSIARHRPAHLALGPAPPAVGPAPTLAGQAGVFLPPGWPPPSGP